MLTFFKYGPNKTGLQTGRCPQQVLNSIWTPTLPHNPRLRFGLPSPLSLAVLQCLATVHLSTGKPPSGARSWEHIPLLPTWCRVREVGLYQACASGHFPKDLYDHRRGECLVKGDPGSRWHGHSIDVLIKQD